MCRVSAASQPFRSSATDTALTLAIELLFVAVFVRALWEFARHRDPLTGELALVFSAMAALFVVGVATQLNGPIPAPVSVVAIVLLLLQPIFTLRLVARLRHVARWLFMWPLVGYAIALAVALATNGFRSPMVSALLVLIFFVAETTAGAFLASEALDHAGAARFRLLIASAATTLFGAALLAAGAGIAGDTAATVGSATSRVLAIASGLGYLVAFMPPRWLRRIWQAGAGYEYMERLLATAPGDTAPELWARFAAAALSSSGTDDVVVLLARPGEPVEHHSSGDAASTDLPGGADSAAVERVTASVPPGVQLPTHSAEPLVGAMAARFDARFFSVVPIPLRDAGSACVLLFARWRTLFTADDSELIAATGAQTALLAERQRILADQRRLTDELATTVRALENASRAKSDFLASMSHELRTPLNAIIGFSELMRGEPSEGGSLQVPAEWVEHIHGSGQHLLSLINDVLDITKVEAGRLDLHTERLDIAHVVTESVAGLRPLADRKDISIFNEVERGAVEADRGRLRQILYNLLSNAIKFTPRGGSIRLEAAFTPETVRVSVADTGVGIAPEDRARVFEEFRQVGDLSNRQEGTGLGLALTRRLVEAHGGSIEFESVVGEGTTFTVVLPRPTLVLGGDETDGRDRALPADAHADSGEWRPSVLVIEDEPSAVRLLRTYIESDDVRVRIATTGEAGLEAARREPPDAIILDVLLPGVDGWEVLRELKSDPSLRDIPVIIVTIVDEREVGLALGAVDYFVKPVDRTALLDRLARYTFTTKVKHRQVRVLAVDDDPAAVAMVEAALAPEGFTVVGAYDGRRAVELAREEPPDLVICDLLMPEMDGFGVVSALKGEERTRQVPILILTAHELTADDKLRLNGNILGVVGKGETAARGLRDWLVGAGARPAAATATAEPA